MAENFWCDEALLRKLMGSGEPFFILRAQDALAVHFVKEWAERAEGAGSPPSKVQNAHRVARAMRQWPVKKVPD